MSGTGLCIVFLGHFPEQQDGCHHQRLWLSQDSQGIIRWVGAFVQLWENQSVNRRNRTVTWVAFSIRRWLMRELSR
jgi:hypothetical protein